MRIPIFDKTGTKRYTVPVGDNSVYVWKFETEEYIQVTFTSDRVLQLKKGWYTDIDGLGRFEIVTLPTPTASTKADGYDYELRMDRPWYKFKNRTIFMRRGSVLGMESKWDLTDTIQAHAGILTDNLTKLGFTYKETTTTSLFTTEWTPRKASSSATMPQTCCPPFHRLRKPSRRSGGYRRMLYILAGASKETKRYS